MAAAKVGLRDPSSYPKRKINFILFRLEITLKYDLLGKLAPFILFQPGCINDIFKPSNSFRFSRQGTESNLKRDDGMETEEALTHPTKRSRVRFLRLLVKKSNQRNKNLIKNWLFTTFTILRPIFWIKTEVEHFLKKVSDSDQKQKIVKNKKIN